MSHPELPVRQPELASPSHSSKPKLRNFREWVRYHFCFSKGVLFASGLLFSDKMIDYLVLGLLITYFLDFGSLPEKGLKKMMMEAAILTMILQGVSALVQLLVSTISIPKALFSRLLVIMVSCLFYTIGSVILYVSSSPAFVSFPYNITGIFLLAVGHAGVERVIGKFIVDQFKNHEPDPANPDKERVTARKNVWCCVVWSFSALAAFLTYKFSYGIWKTPGGTIVGSSNKVIFMVLLLASGSSLILVLCGIIWFYLSGELADIGSSLTTIPHNLKAFLIKMKRLIRKQGRDSACIPKEGQTERNRKSSYFREMGCMWPTLTLFGMVLSAGKFFFPWMGVGMMSENYLPSLVIIQSISRKTISFLFGLLLFKLVPKAENKNAKLVKIWLGVLLSVPCFIVAWGVTRRRLTGKNNYETDMSIFWLVPQFCMLGFMEGLAQDGFEEFMIILFPESRKKYVSAINNFVTGLGNFGFTLSTCVSSRVFGWIYGEESHVDKYLMILPIISSVNLCYHSCISLIYYYKSKKTAETSQTAASLDLGTAGSVSDRKKQYKCLSELVSAFM